MMFAGKHTPEQVRQTTEIADAICVAINRLADERGEAYDGFVLFSALANVMGWTMVGCPPDVREALYAGLLEGVRKSAEDGEAKAREAGIVVPRLS